MREVMEGLWNLSPDIDLVHSPDDEAATGKGYYIQRYPSGETSQLFATQEEAIRAFHMRNIRGAIQWGAG